MTAGDDSNLKSHKRTGSVAASRDSLSVVLADARAFTEAAGLPETPSYRLLVVVEELITNIITHGRPAEGTMIDYGFERQANGVRLTMADSGMRFDPRDLPPHAAVTDTEGGIGWPLILQWCRLEARARTGGRNHMTLVLEDDG